jgi:hypothetical protein
MKLSLNTGLVILASLIALVLPRSGQCFYNCSEGKWLSRDPISEHAFDSFADASADSGSLSENPYVFVNNSPLDSSDYQGLSICFTCVYTCKDPTLQWVLPITGRPGEYRAQYGYTCHCTHIRSGDFATACLGCLLCPHITGGKQVTFKRGGQPNPPERFDDTRRQCVGF